MKAARVAAVLLLILVPVVGSDAPAQTQSPVPKLTARQRTERIRDLPDEERQWLTDYVEPIILPEERDLFLQLTQPYQREAFKAEFWKRREQDSLAPPFGPGYESRYRHLREVAADEYDGVLSDAGRMVIRLGEPASIDVLRECSEVYREAEIWSYPTRAGSGSVDHLFYRPSFGAPRRLWIPGDTGIFQVSSCLSTFDQACSTSPSGAPFQSSSSPCASNTVPQSCNTACRVARVASDIQSRGLAEASVLSRSPLVSTEGLEGLWSRYASLSAAGAKPIAVEGPSSRAPATSSAPAPGPKDDEPAVTGQEDIRNRIQGLPKKYRDWLDLAGPLLSMPELVEFLHLPASGRDAYIRKFWKRHAHTS